MSTIFVEGPGYNSIDLKLQDLPIKTEQSSSQAGDKIGDYFVRLKTQSMNTEKFT